MSENPNNAGTGREAPRIRDARVRPSGIIPRNVQTWIILGISLVMILVIAFSGGKQTKKDPAEAAQKPQNVIDPNEARIQEYRNRIEEDAQKLAAEQERLRQAKAELGLAATQQATTGASSGSASRAQDSASAIYYRSEEREGQNQGRDAIEEDRALREYESLFASNIALTYRKDETAEKEAAPQAERSSQPLAIMSQLPYGLFSASMPVLPQAQPQGQAAGQPNEATVKEISINTANEKPDEQTADQHADNTTAASDIDGSFAKHYRVLEGTILEAVLTNRLSGEFSGPVNCMITTDVYSRDGLHLLIPQGSRALGEVERVDNYGQERLAVRFHRLIMPDGYSVSLDRFQGLNQIGETGLRDKVDRHYARLFGVSLALGALSGLTRFNTRYGIDVSGSDVYRREVSDSLADSATRILDRYLNVLPTFTIREGHRVKIYLAGDLLLPAYD